MSGKWHLGLAEGSRPENHGFDDWFGFMAGCIDFYSHIFYWQMNKDGHAQLHDLWENGIEIYRDGEYFTELITEYTIKYVQRAIEQNKPFFLYVPYNAPHYPMHAPAKYVERFPNLSWDRKIMAAMLSAVDDSVGEILNELERQGILDNTFTYFQSDNGPSREIRNWLDGTPDPYYGGSAGKLKGHKFSLYEGGIRSPGIMSWPDKITAGQVVDQPGAAMDVFPTFLSAAGGDPNDYQLDGKNAMLMLTEGRPSLHDAIFWEMNQQTAVRRGKWKLVLNGQLVEGAPAQDDVHLADLETYMGETNNRKDKHPELTAELTQLAQAWRQGIEDRWQNEWMPKANGTTGKTN